jgi:steroid 5-alpha reductase family enzyme
MRWTQSSSRAVYATSYLVGLGVAAASVAALPASLGDFWIAAAAGMATTVFFYVCSILFKNSGFYDCYWSVAPVVCAFFWMTRANAWSSGPALLALAVTTLWGCRLTANWATHFEGLDHEDWRYVDLRKKTGGAYIPVSFLALHLFPYTLVTAGSYPIFVAIQSKRSVGALDVIALVVGLVAIALETASDLQLTAFRRTNRDPKAFMQSGLWAYSRHPNYCGEAMVWWSFALFGIAAHPSVWMVLGALGVTAMILFASIPMAETRALAKRPHFAEYQRRVSRLIPWFPQRP